MGGYKNGVCWKEPNTYEGMTPESALFEAGHAYTVMAFLEPKDGYEFSSDVTAIINGKPAVVGYWSPEGVRIEYEFSVLESGLSITTQPTSKTVAAGTTVTFKVVATGATSYQWQYSKDGTTWTNCSSAGSNTATFSFVASTGFNGRQYRCQVKNGSVTVTSNATKLTVE